MNTKLLASWLMMFSASGCVVEANDAPPPSAETGTLVVDWTIDGTQDPNQCSESSAADIDVSVSDSAGNSAGEYKESCGALATSIDLPPGRYSANAVLLDSSGAERTTEVPINPFVISAAGETSIPIDFPASSFH